MKAVYLRGGVVSVEEIPCPETPPGHASIRLLCAGICNTDLELQRGYYSFQGIPGHEFVGEVVASPDPHLTGKRVVGEINLGCGTCSFCVSGLARHCLRREVLGIAGFPGAFREYLTLPCSNLHPVPEGLADEQAVFAEPVAAACEILQQVAIPPGSRVAVLGDGKLGLLIAQVLAAGALRVHLFGRHPEKLEIARRAGVQVSATATGTNERFRWVVEATGSPDGFAQAAAMTEPRGTLIAKSTIHGDVAVNMARIVVDEITVLGSRCGPFEPALELLQRGAIDTAAMISERFPLSAAARAFERAAEKGVLKVLLRP